MPESTKVVVLADQGQQRLALADTVRSFGFVLVDSMDSGQFLTQKELPKADLWLVDVDEFGDKFADKLAHHDPKCVLMGFKTAPYLNCEQSYKKWQKSLLRKIGDVLNTPISELIGQKRPQPNPMPWRYVLFLGASMGGPDAIKEFLDNLSPQLPLAVLIAHHFDGNMIETLPRVLTRHNDWRCQVVTTTQSLQSGLCLIAPIDRQVVCDSTGRVILTKQAWSGEYSPSIGDLLKNASEVYGSQLIGIIFSGMGDDGSQHAKAMRSNQSVFWAQDPKSCASASQPQAFIDTGLCQFVGTPKELAQRLTQMTKAFTINTSWV